MTMFQHESVLLEEACNLLVTDVNGIYVDGTLGRAGHSMRLLQLLSSSGRVIGCDKDPTAIAHANNLAEQDGRLQVVHDSFANIDQYLDGRQINGLLLDLGVSSPQLDDADRGFSFMRSGKLDMRMNPEIGISAAELLANISEQDLIDILITYGEERYARRIAAAIIARRYIRPFVDTYDLADVVKQAHPNWQKGKHPATKVFQALRIKVNDELTDLEILLSKLLDLLVVGGRLVIISFHSLEDRIVKNFIRRYSSNQRDIPRRLPVFDSNNSDIRLRKLGKFKASSEQIKLNPRSRSAIMRGAEKIL